MCLSRTKPIQRIQRSDGRRTRRKFLSDPWSLILVVLRKAVAEVSKIGHEKRGKLLRCMDGRANPLMGRKVAGVGVVAMAAVVT